MLQAHSDFLHLFLFSIKCQKDIQIYNLWSTRCHRNMLLGQVYRSVPENDMKTGESMWARSRAPSASLPLEKVKGQSTVLTSMMTSNWNVTSVCAGGWHAQFDAGEFIAGQRRSPVVVKRKHVHKLEDTQFQFSVTNKKNLMFKTTVYKIWYL